MDIDGLISMDTVAEAAKKAQPENLIDDLLGVFGESSSGAPTGQSTSMAS